MWDGEGEHSFEWRPAVSLEVATAGGEAIPTGEPSRREGFLNLEQVLYREAALPVAQHIITVRTAHNIALRS